MALVFDITCLIHTPVRNGQLNGRFSCPVCMERAPIERPVYGNFFLMRYCICDSYDFATLYTNIPHDGLKSNIRNLVREAYKVRGAKYLVVDRHGKAHWSQSLFLTECL